MIRRNSVPSPGQSLEYYVDAAEAARFLSIHPRTLQQLARAGTVPAHPLGSGRRKFWRFLLSELDDWLHPRIDSSCGAVRVIARERKVQ
jgi:excisionase family DNA binding protein